MGSLQSVPSDGDGKRCEYAGFPKYLAKSARKIAPDELYVSGQFEEQDGMAHIGYSMRPTSGNSLFSKTGAFYRIIRTHYSAAKQRILAHQPHFEKSIEVCAIIQGRINYALSTSCHGYYDVVSMKKGLVGVMFPGIAHTASADFREDGEHICFKIYPSHDIPDKQWKNISAAVSQRASAYLDKHDVDTMLEEEGLVSIFAYGVPRFKDQPGGVYKLPGFSRLYVSMLECS
jgi:hypothetical protein